MVCCSAVNCFTPRDRGFRFFRFPANIERRRKWIINCRRDNWEPLPSSALCEEHFEYNQYELNRKDGWKKLKQNAVPTIFIIPSNSNRLLSEKKPEDKDFPTYKKSACIIPDCESTFENEECSFFEVPFSLHERQKWIVAIQNFYEDEYFYLPTSNNSLICAKHFLPDDFIRSMKRKYLKSEAVPSIFSNYLNEYPVIYRRNMNVECDEVENHATYTSDLAESSSEVINNNERDKICRMCAQSDSILMNIFGEECTIHEISKKITTYLPIPLAENDVLSQNICYQCMSALISWHQIFERAITVNRMMEGLLNLNCNKQNNQIRNNLCVNQSDVNGHEYHDKSNGFNGENNENQMRNNNEEKENMLLSFNVKTESRDDETVNSTFALRRKKISPNGQIGQTTYQCDHCGKLFKTRRHFVEHLKRHGFCKTFNCDICGFAFEKRNLVERHIKTVHISAIIRNNNVVTPEALSELHKNASCDVQPESLGNKNRIECSYCTRSFSSKSALSLHVSSSHKNGSLFVCDECDEEFQTESELKAHIAESNHRVEGIKLKHCSLCGADFESRIRYRKHLATKHENAFFCTFCSLVLSTQEEFDQHVQIHPKPKLFKCEYCQKGFRYRTDYRKHVLIHTGEMPFLCEICGKKFNRKYRLKLHANMHYIKMNYVCEICGLDFSSRRDARKHRQLHFLNHEIGAPT